jgi:hypothetical protein
MGLLSCARYEQYIAILYLFFEHDSGSTCGGWVLLGEPATCTKSRVVLGKQPIELARNQCFSWFQINFFPRQNQNLRHPKSRCPTKNWDFPNQKIENSHILGVFSTSSRNRSPRFCWAAGVLVLDQPGRKARLEASFRWDKPQIHVA